MVVGEQQQILSITHSYFVIFIFLIQKPYSKTYLKRGGKYTRFVVYFEVTLMNKHLLRKIGGTTILLAKNVPNRPKGICLHHHQYSIS